MGGAEQLEAAARRYYELVDARRFEELFGLFDEEIVYERGGTPTIRGIDEFRTFYLANRIIASGAHTLELLVVSSPWTIVRGKFEGTLRSNEEVHIRFADFMRFRDSKIVERWSYFAGRAV